MEDLNSIWPEWQIVELIGQGAYGKVYKIKREEMESVSYAALKVIELPQDKAEVRELIGAGMDYQSVQYYYEDLVKNLQNEIQVMETLKTANNIVSIEDYALKKHEEGIGWSVYIRMELLTNLTSYMESINQDIQLEEVVKLGIDICFALDCCEKSHIIHRDIKPDNIFRNQYGDYKLGDFGIAKQMEKTKSAYSQKGTSMYMAPEVYRGQRYDKTVDIYSLGIMLYKLLNYGRYPFMPPYPEQLHPSDAEEAMLKRLGGEAIPAPARVDSRMAEVILRACAYKPQDRYQSASEFKAALEACSLCQTYHTKEKDVIDKENNTGRDYEKTYAAWGDEKQRQNKQNQNQQEQKQQYWNRQSKSQNASSYTGTAASQENRKSEPKKPKNSSSGGKIFSKIAIALIFISVVLYNVINSTNKTDSVTTNNSGKTITDELNKTVNDMNLDSIVVPYLLGETWEDCNIQVNDQVITLPCKVSEIEEKGFCLDKKSVDTMVKAGEQMQLKMKDEKGNALWVAAVNQEDSESPVLNCTVNFISVGNTSGAEKGLIINFPGHIKIGDSLEKVVEQYGEAEQISNDSDKQHGVYTWFTEDNKAVLSIGFSEGNITEYSLSVF